MRRGRESEKLASREKFPRHREAVFVNSLATRSGSRQNAYCYDESVSGGSVYNYFRDYEPEVGRYLQSDPVGLAGGVNRHAYGGSNSISRVDANGLSWTNWCFIDITNPECYDPITPPVGRPPWFFPPTDPNPLPACMAACLGKALVNTLVLVGAGYTIAFISAAYLPPAAVVLAVYVVSTYGIYYTVVKWAYTTNRCYQECRREPCNGG